MLNTAHRLSELSLSRLHPRGLSAPDDIRRLLERARAEGLDLYSGVNKRLERETARVVAVDGEQVRLSAQHLDTTRRTRLLLSLPLDGRIYVFSGAIRSLAGEEVSIDLPERIYVSERRDRPRHGVGEPRVPERMRLEGGEGASAPRVEAEVLDYSGDGAAVRVPATVALPGRLRATPGTGPDAGRALHARVRNRAEEPGGWKRLGLSLRAVETERLVPIEAADDRFAPAGVRDRWRTLTAGLRATSDRVWRSVRRPPRVRLELIEFEAERGEKIRALVDRVGAGPGAPVVLMPPAFAKTKETLLPLARAIVETFAAAGERVAVVRTDGIRRRGESHNDPPCRYRGRELHHFTYSQGVSDIHAALRFLKEDPRFRARKVVLVTFSSGAVEARRAVAEDPTGILAGWVSVVGAADLKSGWQVLSGGIDYIGGYEQGLRFGIQSVLGIEGDIDRIAEDALAHGLAYMEDARRDMARIRVPVTWFRGLYDAWIDPERVRELLSSGDASGRRLVEVPTGHQLRTSSEAFGTFRCVAEEAARFLVGRALPGVAPDLVDLDRRREAERARLPSPEVDLAGFWRGYMLGEEGRLGMDILIETSPYRGLLARQVERLDLRPGQRVADVGSGTGALLAHLCERAETPGLVVHELDLVHAALARARGRLAQAGGAADLRAAFVRVDLDEPRRAGLPLRAGAYDRVLASLLLNYVKDPARLLRELHELLVPDGRLVLTSLRRDADVSRIYSDASTELRAGGAGARLGLSAAEVEESIGQFLNQVGRLLDLEEIGVFQTWSPEELVQLVRRAGFTAIETEPVFGDPAQAILVSAVKRGA